MRRALLGLVILVGGIVGPMAGVLPAVATTPVASTTPVPPVFTDAPAVRDQLLALGMANLDEQANAQFLGFFAAWREPYPGIIGRGSAIEANANGVVSTSRNYMNPKDSNGPANPTVIAFAVADASGRCAGAVIYGYPKTDRSMKIDNPATCSAQGVVTAFRTVFETPPPPITTVPPATTVASPSVVPAPPNTGTGGMEGDPAHAGVLATAIAVFMAGTALAVVSRRK